ncbi:hypothetical protein GCM10011332_31190 [Terasakiella brassicae]|uniref:Uncharacterized protein n=1 Tax=Terasakiella brassicae TaxID=1634917 RepID=A0A917CA18_9PROT|nr:hypothetical protein GCM10011332_31190 [Terasakiella brassicae]
MQSLVKDWKFPAGPIIDPNPGPMFERAVAAPLRAVTKSSPVKLRPV